MARYNKKATPTVTPVANHQGGMGYQVRHKGHSPVMTYASDKLVK